jgi:nicotinamidase-related amidase
MTEATLVLIDIQNDYFPGGRMTLPGSPEAGQQAHRLLEHFRRRALPTVHVQHLAASPGATFFLPGTEGAELHASVAPKPDERVVQKHFPNSFRETGLLELLRADGAKRLVLCGMMTHMCVDATVRAAADLGFECLLAHDACATRALSQGGVTVPAEHVHLAFLAALGSAYAQVQSTDEILAQFA